MTPKRPANRVSASCPRSTRSLAAGLPSLPRPLGSGSLPDLHMGHLELKGNLLFLVFIFDAGGVGALECRYCV